MYKQKLSGQRVRSRLEVERRGYKTLGDSGAANEQRSDNECQRRTIWCAQHNEGRDNAKEDCIVQSQRKVSSSLARSFCVPCEMNAHQARLKAEFQNGEWHAHYMWLASEVRIVVLLRRTERRARIWL